MKNYEKITDVSAMPFIHGISNDDKRLTMRVILTESATPQVKVPAFLPFTYTIKQRDPQLLRLQGEWTIDLVKSLSNEEIGGLVRKMLNQLAGTKEKIEELS